MYTAERTMPCTQPAPASPRQGNVPVAMATWALVSDAIDARITAAAQAGAGAAMPRLQPQEWKSGETVWLMDILAPFGGQDKVAEEIKAKVFPARPVKTLQPDPKSGGLQVVER